MSTPDSLTALQSVLRGRYTIERSLGRGGMATVYLAEEQKHQRAVALKVLEPELSPTIGADRFLREIGIAARLSHPHLVPLIDSGEAGGMLYYVSAFLPGGSLRDRLRSDGRLPVADALRMVDEVGSALDYVHRAGFVHRDVKPENILFADGLALLADFGIARATAPAADDGDRRRPFADALTGGGMVLGTPEYMSPEQASGEPTLDGRTDIYSLACVLYEALTGQPPFTGGSVRAVIAGHMATPPRRLRTHRSDIPVGLEHAVMRALSKDPADRFATVGEFTAALRAALPVTASHSAIPTIGTRSIAVLPFVNASPEPENEYLSDGITDEIIDALAKVDGIRVASRTSVFALKGKPQDVRATGALLDCGVVLEGTVRRAGERLRITAQLTSTDDGRLLWSHRYDRQFDDVFAIQDEIARTIVNTLLATSFADLAAPSAARHTASTRAYHLYLKGRYEWNRRTQEGVAAGIRYFDQAIAEDSTYALAFTGLADCYALEVDYRSVPVGPGFEAAKRNARRAIELDPSLAEAHASLAWCVFVYDWDWVEAERLFRRAIDLDPRYATAHQWFAFLLASRGMLEESLVEGHTAVELDQGSVSARRSLAWAYFYARRFEQGRYHLDRAIAMNPNAEESYRVLGLTLAVGGQPEEAVRVLAEARSLPESGSYTLGTLGYALARAGEIVPARRILAELQARAAREYVSPVALATTLFGLGDVEGVLDWTERALEQRRGWLVYLRVNPLMEPMRGHPRFDALIERMHL